MFMRSTAASTDAPRPKLRSRPLVASFIIFGGLAALLLGLAVSVSVGAADIKLSTVWEAVFRFNPDLTQHQIIKELRLPRALAGALVGIGFAVSGAIMQGMTRNPLADPGLLGINAGAGFVLALCFAFFPGLPFHYLILFSFAGAAIGAGLVYGVSSMAKGGLSPVRLALAGAAVSALLLALSEGIAIYFHISQDLAFWYAGGVAGTKWLQIKIVWPWILGGIIGALVISRSITVLSLGDEIAAGLGQRTGWVKAAGMLLSLVLAGTSVSAVGSIGFVGLVIPHMARALVGVDYRWIIPCSGILGALLMVIADIGARMINPPFETPIGALIALIGVPFFLYLARKERREL
ncbi:iron ABC transporter permease [Paenibacillus sp. CGMCC 1.16610]|uniref:Iron chelate uptake ABC transporter family permease subunit n=2 Tax=Paenibacillus TaxID=44249 RepID=A0ABW9UD23_9BACL|nr:iron ABC transporter permease [Paenibacillus sp. CGMCC 1.16610]MBA2944177.1 iron ABC transporter permease [Paenibacillus sp. CGMCC 1.16610]MVQ38067.1 iron chelate uptake ABC transporter family permease subunit [Paenibacillus anseongense]